MGASVWAPGSQTINVDAENTFLGQALVVSAGQTLLTLSAFSYVVDTGSICVFRGGQKLIKDVDYEETDSTHVTLLFNDALEGEVFEVVGIIGAAGAASVAAAASAVSAEAAKDAAELAAASIDFTLDSVSEFSNKTMLATEGNRIEAVSGPNGSQLAGLRNKIINGGCQVQQRSSVALTGTAQYGGVDRFQMFVSGTGVGGFFGPVANANFTSGAAIGTASFATTGGRPWINQKIEAANSIGMNGKTVTVRARVYHSQGTTIPWRIGFNKANSFNNFGSETFLGNATMSVANVPSATYTDIIGTYTFGASDCTNGINVLFNPTSDNTYASGAFYIGEFQLEEGSIATPFEQRPFGLELALCQRYFHRVPSRLLLGGYATSGSTYYVTVSHPVVMRAAPVIENLTSASNSGFGATVVGDYTPYFTRLQAPALSTGAGVFYAAYDATAEL